MAAYFMNKNLIRTKYLQIRRDISLQRKEIAKKNLLKLKELNFKNILSFASTNNEINLWSLNFLLQKENRLFLPKIENNLLKIYKVDDIQTDLIKNEKLNILEPNLKKCTLANINEISCILVPGLVFDKKNHRLGYGLGFYDKLLYSSKCPTIGVGFLEQLSERSLPIEKHDIKLNQVMLF
jgi:5-formyltetrahydrofolate cyclo-ligase